MEVVLVGSSVSDLNGGVEVEDDGLHSEGVRVGDLIVVYGFYYVEEISVCELYDEDPVVVLTSGELLAGFFYL